MRNLPAIGFCLLILSSFAQAATLSLSPASANVLVNNTFSVNITLNTQGAAIDGVDVILDYNTLLLQAQDANANLTGVQISPGSLMPSVTYNSVNATSGRIFFSQVPSFGSTYSGSGVLATVTFKGLVASSPVVAFEFTPGSTTDSNVASNGTELLSSVVNGAYTVTNLPVISNVSASFITSGSAMIAWNTDVPSDSQVDFGLNLSFGNSTALDVPLVTIHSESLTNLLANTTYYYRVKSRDTYGNLVISAARSFVTLPPADTTPPGFLTVNVTSITQNSSVVNWDTNESSDSQVEYGLNLSFGNFTVLDPSLVMSHSQTLTNLLSGTTYYYRVRSRDGAGNLAISATRIFTTLNATPVRRLLLTLEGTSNASVFGQAQFIDASNLSLFASVPFSSDSSGQAYISVPLGVPTPVNIRIAAPGYLSRLLLGPDVTTFSTQNITVPQLLSGDLSGDNVVNSLDFSVMNKQWLSSGTGDYNRDGVVNSLDFSLLEARWWQQGE